MMDYGLGDADAVFQAWREQVRRDGGRPTTLPKKGNGPPVAAAAYPKEIWVAKVNGHVWPMPDAYSTDGQTAYYVASPAVQSAMLAQGNPDDSDAPGAGSVSIPDTLGKIGDSLASAAKWGIIALLLAKALDFATAVERRRTR